MVFAHFLRDSEAAVRYSIASALSDGLCIPHDPQTWLHEGWLLLAALQDKAPVPKNQGMGKRQTVTVCPFAVLPCHQHLPPLRHLFYG